MLDSSVQQSKSALCIHKNLPPNAGDVRDTGSIPGSGRSPGGENGKPLQILPGESHGQKSLVGYSPWGCKESDMTSTFTFHFNVLYSAVMNKTNPHCFHRGTIY